MLQMKNRYIILLTVALTAMYIILRQSGHPTPTVNPEASPADDSPKPTIIEEPLHCLDQQIVTDTLKRNYQLTSEEFFSESGVLECKYESTEQVNSLPPSMKYVLHTQQPKAQEVWQTQQAVVKAHSSYRSIEEDTSLFANVNPVKELSQVTFYGFRRQNYLEMNYTPVKEEVGVQLNKGMLISQQILHVAP